MYAYDWNNFNYVKYDSLAAGVYTLSVTAQWNSDDVKDYTVRVYGPNVVSITTPGAWWTTKKSLSNPIVANFTSLVLNGLNAAIGSNTNATTYNNFNTTD